MSPSRPPDSPLLPPRSLGVTHSIPVYEVVKARILIKLQERLEGMKARRMPPSLLAEAARQQVDQLIEVEAARLTRPDRDKVAREVVEEAFGFGPLEELFADPGVKEITLLGAQAVLVRRDHGWLPTNVRFRDEGHVAELLGRARGQGEAVAPGLPDSVLDVRLGNGFRVVAILPPAATGTAPLATFVRAAAAPAEVHPGFVAAGSGAHPVPASRGGGTREPARLSGGGGTHTPLPPQSRPGSGAVPAPPGRSVVRPPTSPEAMTERHRQRITERFTAKLAALGVFDLSGIDSAELRKVIAAYVDEYCRTERIFLTDTDKGRVTLEILTGMGR